MDLFDVLKMLAALTATLALIAGAAYIARRFGMLELKKQDGEKRIRVVESLMLDPRRRLIAVQFGGQEHLILLSPSGDRALASAQSRPPAVSSEISAEGQV
ncbi:MAG: flagellar biosynthetic protein FliO [Caulobacterales bacterium]